jgi:hypothetical protein
MLVSSLSDTEKLDSFIEKNNLTLKKICEKDLFYETLKVIELCI